MTDTGTRKYRKRPVVIDAYQTLERMEISTLEGVMIAEPGDWIIKGVEGEIYPCKDSIFQKTYELAERPMTRDISSGIIVCTDCWRDYEENIISNPFECAVPKGSPIYWIELDRYCERHARERRNIYFEDLP